MRLALRRLIHSAVLASGFRLVRVTPFERALRRWELVHDDFYFVQIGAHNGVTSDPFQRFVAEGVWNCILVEPQASSFEILKTIYCDRDKVQCIHAAIGPHDGFLSFFKVRSGIDGLPYWSDQLMSTSRDVIISHADRIPNIQELIETVELPCRTLQSVLSEHQWPGLTYWRSM